jgi:adenylate kinase family enzyme
MSDDSSPDKIADDLAIENEVEKSQPKDSTSQSLQKPARFQSGEQLNFNFIAYEEKIVIVGASGSGKTYLANQIMKGLNGITVWVFDPNYQFHSSRAMVFNDLDEMLKVYDSAKRGHYILQPHDSSEYTFRRFNAEAFKRGNITLIEDEIHNWLTKQKVLKEFNQVILSGRPRGISVISISSRPASCPNHILSNVKHVFAFKLNLESDVKFLEGYLGNDVWILMPPDKRARLKDEPALEEHTFFYRDMDLDHGVLGKV